MSSWGNKDAAANTPFWATAAVNLAPTSSNAAALFENTTADYFAVDLENGGTRFENETVGLFGVDAAEIQASSGGHGSGAHTGWVLRTTGSGGRAGRVQQETLVALSNFTTDNNGGDDALYPDAVITVTNPTALRGPISAASSANVSFSVVGTSVVPSTATLSYQWQVNNNSGGTWVNIDAGTNVSTGQPGQMTKSGATTATLVLDPTGTSANNYVFRAVITATNPGITGSSATAYSSNGRILITA
jgi:hypothetical protein